MRKGFAESPRRVRPSCSARARLLASAIYCSWTACAPKALIGYGARRTRERRCIIVSNFELLFFARTRTRGGARPPVGPQGVEIDRDCALKPKLSRVARIGLVFFDWCVCTAIRKRFSMRVRLSSDPRRAGRTRNTRVFYIRVLTRPPLPAHERGGSAAGDRPRRGSEFRPGASG